MAVHDRCRETGTSFFFLLTLYLTTLQPFLAQAEHEKMEYEAARRLYEDGAPAYGTNINFSILPNSPAFAPVKMESSESDSEGFSTDDGDRLPQS